MKYRRLSASELHILEQDFVHFLVANTITAEDWEKLKQQHLHKAEALIDLFSEVVFERSIGRTEFLIHTQKNEVHLFHCKPDTIHLVKLFTEQPSHLDFTAMTLQEVATSESIFIITQSKKYHPDRNQEIYRMLENGCRVTDDSIAVFFN